MRRPRAPLTVLSISRARQVETHQLMEDLQFLMGRPEEEHWLRDLMQSVSHRRQWVSEREAHERERCKRPA